MKDWFAAKEKHRDGKVKDKSPSAPVESHSKPKSLGHPEAFDYFCFA